MVNDKRSTFTREFPTVTQNIRVGSLVGELNMKTADCLNCKLDKISFTMSFLPQRAEILSHRIQTTTSDQGLLFKPDPGKFAVKSSRNASYF